MKVLYVFLIIFAVLFLILSLKISLCFEFYNIRKEKYTAYIRIAFFKYTIFPWKKKKPKKASPEKKKKKEKPKKELKKTEEKIKYEISEILDFIRAPLNILSRKFKKYLKTEAADLNITVASDDAFKTAVTFGLIAQSVWYIKALLEHNLNAKIKNINVSSDFSDGKTKFDINLKFSIRFYQIMSISFTSAAALVRWITLNKNKKVDIEKG